MKQILLRGWWQIQCLLPHLLYKRIQFQLSLHTAIRSRITGTAKYDRCNENLSWGCWILLWITFYITLHKSTEHCVVLLTFNQICDKQRKIRRVRNTGSFADRKCLYEVRWYSQEQKLLDDMGLPSSGRTGSLRSKVKHCKHFV